MTRNSQEAGQQIVLTSDVSSSMRSSSKSKSVAAACPADDFTGAPASLQRKRREKSQFGSRILFWAAFSRSFWGRCRDCVGHVRPCLGRYSWTMMNDEQRSCSFSYDTRKQRDGKRTHRHKDRAADATIRLQLDLNPCCNSSIACYDKYACKWSRSCSCLFQWRGTSVYPGNLI